MALILELKVVPLSGKQRCFLDKAGILKCYLKSAPEGGKANNELCKFLSKALKIPQEHVTILAGATSRKKVIKLDTTLPREQVYELLGIEQQLTF